MSSYTYGATMFMSPQTYVVALHASYFPIQEKLNEHNIKYQLYCEDDSDYYFTVESNDLLGIRLLENAGCGKVGDWWTLLNGHLYGVDLATKHENSSGRFRNFWKFLTTS